MAIQDNNSIWVFDYINGLGGSYTVSFVRSIDADSSLVKIWYGKPTSNGWEGWSDFNGYEFVADNASLKNGRALPLIRNDQRAKIEQIKSYIRKQDRPFNGKGLEFVQATRELQREGVAIIYNKQISMYEKRREVYV